MSYSILQSVSERAEPSFSRPSAPVLNNSPGKPPARAVAGAEKIRESVEFMKQRLDHPLQAATLASRVNISQSHYFALFKRVTGLTPIDYFTRLRIQRACVLLGDASARVKCVAAAVGYEDPFYFSRVFKSIQGVAPSDYRDMCLEARARSLNPNLSGSFDTNGIGLRQAENSPSKK